MTLSDGWYRGRWGNWQLSENYGDTVAFLGQLHAGDIVVTSDEDWTSALGPIRAADLMTGQAEDHRIESTGWAPVAVVDHDLTRLAYSPAPPTRAVEHLRALSVRRLTPERQVADLGQNINGWVRLSDLGPRNTELTLVHGEALDADGNVTLAHLANDQVCVAQTDAVVSAGREGDMFEPRHTTHGFQYVQIDGHPHRLTPDDIIGVVVHTDMRRTGWFRCSDERVNRFHEIAEWSFRGNACEVPTDCPTRERAGYTGDWQVFLPSAAFLYDVAGFSRKWLRDLILEQRSDGCVLNIVPDPKRARGLSGPDDFWPHIQGSAGWGDAVVMVPWELYRGTATATSSTSSGRRWSAGSTTRPLARRRNATPIAPKPVLAQPRTRSTSGTAASTGASGPSRAASVIPSGRSTRGTSGRPSYTTAHNCSPASASSSVTNLMRRASSALATNTLQAWRTEYVTDDGTLTPDTQAAHVRALAFDLVPEDLRARTATRLVELIRAADTHLATGFLATRYLLPVLADTGHLDVAYELLRRDTEPSWLTMVERGATTVWEDWDGIAEDGTARGSLNHYSKGAVISFLHSHVGGLQLLDEHPAYRRFRVAPTPGGDITWCEVAHDAPYGRIESSWQLEAGHFRLTTTVPPGTTAEIVLPDGTRREQSPGTAVHECVVR